MNNLEDVEAIIRATLKYEHIRKYRVITMSAIDREVNRLFGNKNRDQTMHVKAKMYMVDGSWAELPAAIAQTVQEHPDYIAAVAKAVDPLQVIICIGNQMTVHRDKVIFDLAIAFDDETPPPIPFCCAISCNKPAEYEIISGVGCGDLIYSCFGHISALITDSQQHMINRLPKRDA